MQDVSLCVRDLLCLGVSSCFLFRAFVRLSELMCVRMQGCVCLFFCVFLLMRVCMCVCVSYELVCVGCGFSVKLRLYVFVCLCVIVCRVCLGV